jgi:Protein of unknown function with HXXEE motif
MADDISSDSLTTICLWVFPVVYLLHIAEEYWGGGGFPAYVARTRGIYLSPTKFLLLNGIGLALTIIGVSLARRLGFTEWLLVCLATVVLINGLSHTVASLVRVEYNPGFVTGLLLFIPLGAATLAYMKRRRMRGRRYAGALIVGAAIHGVIFLLTASGGNIPTPAG